ncbi:hypothetical protein LINPERHAP2_LOCUS7039, partial [Linum perenne]
PDVILATLGPTPSRKPEQAPEDPLETFQKVWPKHNEESLARRSWHPKIDPGTSPGPGEMPELSSRIEASIPVPAPALEDP